MSHNKHKKPQDHQKKNDNTIKFTTQSGFKCKFDRKAFFDMRFLDAIVMMEDGGVKDEAKGVAMMRAVRFLLGEEQKDAFYLHIAEKNDGHVSVEAVSKELYEIIRYVGNDKKK